MKKAGKAVFPIIVVLILIIGYFTMFGLTTYYGDIPTTIFKSANDIRWGIDIRGGVDVTFSPPEGVDATSAEMDAAQAVIEQRLVAQNITDSEVYTDHSKDRIIVRFPWKADESDFDAEQAIAELGEMASLTFREGAEVDSTGAPAGVTAENIILDGSDIVTATAGYTQTDSSGAGQYVVTLEMNEEGRQAFAEATERLIGGYISIWMDNTLISAPVVNEVITEGQAMITGGSEGGFTREEAVDLANTIAAGALPFALVTENFNIISPTLGLDARDAMLMAGVIAFILVALIMIVMYRLPGFVATIALLGQVILMIASITGFFAIFPSFTLTLPGIAGIILSIGFGVDANIITAERIKEELYNGRSVEAAVDAGFKRAFSAILDSNVTVIIVAIILMGAFGPTDGIFSKLLTPVFFMFGPSTTGSIYSFGYTLMVGVILNMLMGVLSSKLMLKSLVRYAPLRKKALFGGKDA